VLPSSEDSEVPEQPRHNRFVTTIPERVTTAWLSGDMTDFTLSGHAGALHARSWEPATEPRYVALLCHGYGEHLGRYEHVADRLTADGAAVYALDHVGHGESEGERVLIEDFEPVVEDFRLLQERAAEERPGLPVVLIGHSRGGMIGARYAQKYGDSLACVVLSGPVLGRWPALEQMLPLEEIPDVPIDPDTLSRDPAVGAAYVADPLVWHGPFKKPTVHALAEALATITDAGAVDSTPVLWLHGEEDQLVPYAGTSTGWDTLAGRSHEAKVYPGARHEIFNETNQDEVLDDVLAFVHRHLDQDR
jgi:alpha-beta hydrolase superfamily lysophospholipase